MAGPLPRSARDLKPLGEWAAPGALAVLDQAAISGAGFVLNLLLAMWLAPAEYGAFAVGFSIFLVLAGLHNSLLIEPVSILGPSRHAARLPGYLRRQVALHFILTLPGGALLAAAGWSLVAIEPTSLVGRSLLGLAVALPLLLLFWTLRRFQYIHGAPARALAGSTAYLISLVTMTVAARAAGALSGTMAFIAMGVAGLIASVPLRMGMSRNGASPGAPPPSPPQHASIPGLRPPGETPPLAALLREQWRFGRWMIAASLLSAAGLQLYSVICAATAGLEAAGTLRAVEILMLPMAQGITAVATLALPRLAADHGRGDLGGFTRKGHLLGLLFTAAALLYEGALVIWHADLEGLLYGGRYAEQSWLIPVMGLVPVLTAASMGFTLMLKAAQLPAHYFVNGLVSFLVGVPLALGLGGVFGVSGFAWSFVLTHAAILLAVLVMYRRWIRPAVLLSAPAAGEAGVTT